MKNSIGWKFPPNGDGMEHGWKNNEIAHFKGAQYPNLAREIIQNSLDAALSSEKTVNVSFEFKNIPVSDIDGGSLKESLQACLADEAENSEGPAEEIEEAIKLLSSEKIGCLVISDKNTTGLSGDNWKSLVKSAGRSNKQDRGSGGSHGAGKNAPFAISPLRTVFYWTSYKNDDGKVVEKLQGRSILATHSLDEDTVQYIGFWGEKNGCRETESVEHMPKDFRRTELNQSGEETPIQGTSVIVLGFSPSENWREQIARGVVSSFFYAIYGGKLDVTIEPEPDDSSESQYYKEIDSKTLDSWFKYLLGRENGEDEIEEHSDVRTAYLLHSIHQESDTHKDTISHGTLGNIDFYIRQESGLPSCVGIIRKTGMLITTEQNGLKKFPGFKPFIALVIMEDTEGNAFLKRMENVQHNAFSEEWLPSSEKSKGEKALKELCRSIRDAVKEIAGRETKTARDVMEEIARLLPEVNREDDNLDIGDGTDTWKELSFKHGQKGTTRKPPTPKPPPGPPKTPQVNIVKVRITQIEVSPDIYKLAFQPNLSGDVVLTIEEQGGYSTYPIEGLAMLDRDMKLIKTVTVEANTKTEMFVRNKKPLHKMRCKISARTDERSV